MDATDVAPHSRSLYINMKFYQFFIKTFSGFLLVGLMLIVIPVAIDFGFEKLDLYKGSCSLKETLHLSCRNQILSRTQGYIFSGYLIILIGFLFPFIIYFSYKFFKNDKNKNI